ncbi:MAG: AraC family transcriptional regulator [Bacteroidales bacterium]|jgi:AraC-like DNA-binding protein|nr:AraC family transcriptional regulator [Bacteroidales bacterium]
MNQIPTHQIHEISTSGIVLKHVREGDAAQNGELVLHVSEVHRDNYYVFFFLESGDVRMLVDFKEYHIRDTALGCVFPGQVHHWIASDNVSGWAMCLDATFVKDEWKEIFETVLISGNSVVVPDTGALRDLRFCFELLDRKMQSADRLSAQHTVYALAIALSGIIAEMYRQHQTKVFNKRLMSITLQFKTLIASRLKTVKSPASYASLLHISPAYLNEAVKKTTGFPAGYWIQSAAVLEAKRLLFYTDRSIREIAFELGYDDHTYFTRLFTKLSGIPPSLFRTNYRK